MNETANEADFLCDEHQLMKSCYCRQCVELFCAECKEKHPHFLNDFPEDIKLSYILYKFLKTSTEIDFFLVKRIDSNIFYLLYLFKENYGDFFKTELKERLFFINHPNISKFLYKWLRSRILAEAYDKPLILNEKTLVEILPQILNILDYLHNSLGIYHGDFSENCLKIKGNRLFLIGIMYAITPKKLTPATIYQYQRKDLEDLRRLIEKTVKLQGNSQEIEFSDDHPLKSLYSKLLECEKNATKPSISELKASFSWENPKKTLLFSKEARSPLRNFKLSRRLALNSLAILNTFDEIRAIKLTIAVEKENLSKEFYKKGFEFQHLMQKTLVETRVQVLNIRINPSFVLVSPTDNWRTFWWYAFYKEPHARKTDQRTKISLRLQSKNDWFVNFIRNLLKILCFLLISLIKSVNFTYFAQG